MKIKEAPLYRKLYEQLRKMIEDGTYKIGDLLPSENELCAAHHLTRPTVRNALDMLVYEGFIIRQQGKGSIVQGKPKGIGILSLIGTTSAIGEDHLTTHIIMKPQVRAWDNAFSYDISDTEKSVGCIYIERLRLINDVPDGVETISMRLDRIENSMETFAVAMDQHIELIEAIQKLVDQLKNVNGASSLL